MAQHLKLLRCGEPILKPVYRHADGTFGPPVYLRAGRFLIVERCDLDADGRYLGFEDVCMLQGLPVAAKYDGSFRHTCENDTYTVTLSLRAG